MSRKRTPDILGEALRGEFPLALKPAAPPHKKTRKKAKPSPMPEARPAEFMPFIRDILVELGPMAREFIKGTVADGLSGAIDVIADQKAEITQLKTNVSHLETRIGELAMQLNELIANGISRPIAGSVPPSGDGRTVDQHVDLPPVPAEAADVQRNLAHEPEAKPQATPLEEKEVSAEPAAISPAIDSSPVREDSPESTPRVVEARPETKRIDESRITARKEAEKTAEERYRAVLVKTILNMRAKQNLNPVQIAERFENGGLKPLDGQAAWDAEMVKSLVRGKRP